MIGGPKKRDGVATEGAGASVRILLWGTGDFRFL